MINKASENDDRNMDQNDVSCTSKQPRRIKTHSRKHKKRKFAGNRHTGGAKTKTKNQVAEVSMPTTSSTHGSMPSKRASFERRVEASQQYADDETDDCELSDAEINSEIDPDEDSEVCSASDWPSSDSEEDEVCSMSGFRIVDIEQIRTLISQTCCQQCQSKQGLELMEQTRWGLANELVVECKNCEHKLQCWSSKKVGKSFEVNRRATLATRRIGKNYTGLRTWCGLMNIPKPMTQNVFANNGITIGEKITKMATKSMKNAAKCAAETTGSSDLTVTSDGAWSRRGFASNLGIVAAMSTDTDQIIDIEVLCKQCKSCTMWEGRKGTPEYDAWKETHNCNINHEGSSGKMESQGAKHIWERSVQERGVYYTTMVGDGDSSTYATIKDTYESDSKTVQKGECVGHVQKRVGKNLRELTKKHTRTCNPLSDGKGIGGKGRLTQERIDSMQTFYGRVIRDTVKRTDITDDEKVDHMKSGIMAIPYHRASTDSHPQHQYCPPGERSWCGWQRDRAKGTDDYKHHDILPVPVFQCILPTFVRLSDKELLKKCLHGGTQNRNESFHHVVWSITPKAQYQNYQTFVHSVHLAVCLWNTGAGCLATLLSELGIAPGAHTLHALATEDKFHLNFAKHKQLDTTKRRRTLIRSRNKKFYDVMLEKEDISYGAGHF